MREKKYYKNKLVGIVKRICDVSIRNDNKL